MIDSGVLSMEFKEKLKLLFAGTWDGTVDVFDFNKALELNTLHKDKNNYDKAAEIKSLYSIKVTDERIYRVKVNDEGTLLFALSADSKLNKICLKSRKVIQTFVNYGRNDHDRALDISFDFHSVFAFTLRSKALKTFNYKKNKMFYFGVKGKVNSFYSVVYISPFQLFVGAGYGNVQFICVRSKKHINSEFKYESAITSLHYNHYHKFLFCLTRNSLEYYSVSPKVLKKGSININNSFYSIRFLSTSKNLVVCGGPEKLKFIESKRKVGFKKKLDKILDFFIS
jgi:WD40 repeat protein